jgi:hypothetical protein
MRQELAKEWNGLTTTNRAYGFEEIWLKEKEARHLRDAML